MVRHLTVKNLITGEVLYDTLHAKAESKVSRQGHINIDRGLGQRLFWADFFAIPGSEALLPTLKGHKK